jgi:hypothetical protein
MIEAAHEIALLNQAVMKEGALPVWTIYDHPRDHPTGFVARMHISSKGEVKASPQVVAVDLDALRIILQDAGLTCICRSESDDPVIVESWL